ncbi:hypothetical protein V6N12_053938 [Hibiscus sabdariffa]|uniref:RNase H type-1 domain-containing protein n=1 Tax=Hibiscus sabdariffa TaxID=183260 RepID=A0ABR2D9D8_9ROSI
MKSFGNLEGWWDNPGSVAVPNIANHRVTGECFKFSVVAVKAYNLWGFGGILFSEKGEIRAIFSGPVLKSGWFIAEREAIREALQFFVAADSFGGRALVVESRSRVVNLQAQLASLKEQAAQACSANPNDKYYGKLPSQAQQLHDDVQSWFHPHDSTMAPPGFNPNHSSSNSYREYGFSDPTSLGNNEISSSSGEDRSSFTAIGGEAPPASLEQWSFQDMDDLQSMAFGYALHS